MDEVRLGSRTLQPRRQLLVNGRREPIGKRALDLLSVLAAARGGIVTKDELFEAVWPGVIVEENALQVQIVALRKALGPEADRLQTIRGVGYRLVVDDVPDESSAELGAAGASSSRNVSLGTRLRALWPKARAPRLALAFAGVLLVAAGIWTMLGAEFGLRPQERIPVVVHALAATTSGDTAEEGLAGGITDELILRLRRVPELRIATAAPDGTVPGNEFENAYVVDGNIRSSGDRVRVTARLVDAGGEILWSETFDRNLVDLFDVQQEIAAAIAGALSVSFDVGARSTQYGGTDNPEAYAAYMQSLAHQLDLDQSVPRGYLEQAVALDPDFVMAQYGLTFAYTNLAANSTGEEAESWLAKVDEVSARALAANPDIWPGYGARSTYEWVQGNLEESYRLRQKAEQLNKGRDPQLQNILAINDISLGRVRKSVVTRRANELIDPIYVDDPWKIYDLMLAGKYRDSIDLYSRLERQGRTGLQGYAYHAFSAHLLLGPETAAMRFAEQRNLPFGGLLQAFKANTALLTMSDEELKRSQDGVFPYNIGRNAHFAGYTGHPQLAVRLMRIALERPGGTGMLFYLWHPTMAEARKTDEFERLVTDRGLVKFWRESGDWGDYCRPLSATEITCH